MKPHMDSYYKILDEIAAAEQSLLFLASCGMRLNKLDTDEVRDTK
jgi:hypothetical protein